MEISKMISMIAKIFNIPKIYRKLKEDAIKNMIAEVEIKHTLHKLELEDILKDSMDDVDEVRDSHIEFIDSSKEIIAPDSYQHMMDFLNKGAEDAKDGMRKNHQNAINHSVKKRDEAIERLKVQFDG
jgi:S-methylmethionine-dependent homocysteine/selenocysteine methylase